jgi:dTDP-3-amino-2,3,6-trideoxy-4-keto-D-glucose/dTDP-3-amino-3,4,6-trideoxy-alpha-D-glucose/dTDP-2,6-dideoxy-D-kanosamine transaminase
MYVKYLDLPKKFEDEALLEEVRKVFETCHFVQGPEVEKFETSFAELCGTKYALGLNSGTDAIFLALKTFDIGLGDEVITAPNSFVASAGAVAAAGGIPVFVDVANDYNIDVKLIEGVITPKTKAIIPVHLTGNLADMTKIMEIAKRHDLQVIEDSAQSVGSAIKNRSAGSFGDVGCFSLHPLKNLNAGGDGGVLTTDSEEIYNSIKMLRNHGFKNRDEVEFFGFNSRLDSIQAVIVNYGLKQLEDVSKKRIANAALYDRELGNMEEFVIIPPRDPDKLQTFHTYVVQVEDRKNLISYLKENNVQTKIHYPIPIHLQKPGLELGYKKGDFPICESQSDRILSLPIHQFLTKEQILYVAELIKQFYKTGPYDQYYFSNRD